ncbi:GNAT superfamily N-acetyltransferase [Paraburkholderia bannensis]|uniref:GNAT superfamily N-acetyltransferase n=1 Tax=Paraburkholderia bannensis TaxID=765414 RepID=A0A7W9U3Y1_9BURK|nr:MULTISPECIES: GNAT family N-acetyltransferase [Paraburkholderia]MBB3261610.1 GNAT superfamily N-acetyltransferase [Paraburkholderia sp. WP4_3_2]MBB6106607.1 GNAT superfamily N-acetyltransferase [Paraburkholderia bannensis]
MSESAVTPELHDLHYRRFSTDDIDAAHGLSAAVRWPHRPDDWRFAFDAGAGFVAEENGVVIGTALCWKFGVDRATLGMVIVSPDQQGRGIGRKLMELVLEELGDRVTFLHATPAGQPLYEKLGFAACGALTQHQGNVEQAPAVTLPQGETLREITPADLPVLIELASRGCGLDRSITLPALLEVAQGGVVLECDGEITGFALARRFGRGYAIGPLVAAPSPDHVRAKALVSHWLAQHVGDFVRLDLPGDAGIETWLPTVGLLPVDSVVKMVRNASAAEHSGTPDAAWRAYGIINQAMA